MHNAFLDPLFIVKEFFAIRFKNKNDHLGKTTAASKSSQKAKSVELVSFFPCFNEEGDTPLINAKQGDQKSDMFLSTHALIVNSVKVVAFQFNVQIIIFLPRKN